MINRNRVQFGIPLFLVLTFLFSWLFWWPGSPVTPRVHPTVGGLIGAFGPTLAAIVTLALIEGRAALGRALRRLIAWRIGWRRLLFVLFYPALLSLSVTLIAVAAGRAGPDWGRPLFVDHYPLPSEAQALPFLAFLPLVFVQQTLIGSSMGEELGWRGYLLPRLQTRWGALPASLFIGAVWALWHLPLVLTPDNLLSTIPFAVTLSGTVASAVVFTWVFNWSDGSLVPALLLHTAINVTGLFLAEATVEPWIGAVVAWVVPLYLIVRTHGHLGYTGTADREQAPGSVTPSLSR